MISTLEPKDSPMCVLDRDMGASIKPKQHSSWLEDTIADLGSSHSPISRRQVCGLLSISTIIFHVMPKYPSVASRISLSSLVRYDFNLFVVPFFGGREYPTDALESLIK
jgi:hypothetical protein